MSAKTVALSLSVMGAHRHIQYFLALDTLGEITSQQNSNLDGPQAYNTRRRRWHEWDGIQLIIASLKILSDLSFDMSIVGQVVLWRDNL
jgi:hypothetical protein